MPAPTNMNIVDDSAVLADHVIVIGTVTSGGHEVVVNSAIIQKLGRYSIAIYSANPAHQHSI
jgi:hypothetical protein